MKYLFFFFGLSLCGFGQNSLHHQMLSSQGTSKVLSNGTYVSQTIGQQSLIGNYSKNGTTYGQGFQQSVWNKYIQSTTNNPITTVVYPNPFISTINFQFSQPIKDVINIELFDIRGRLVFQKQQHIAFYVRVGIFVYRQTASRVLRKKNTHAFRNV